MDSEEVLSNRKNKFLSIGRNKGFLKNSLKDKDLSMKLRFSENLKGKILRNKNEYMIFSSLLILFGLIVYFL